MKGVTYLVDYFDYSLFRFVRIITTTTSECSWWLIVSTEIALLRGTVQYYVHTYVVSSSKEASRKRTLERAPYSSPERSHLIGQDMHRGTAKSGVMIRWV
jgi:hypothetical protein